MQVKLSALKKYHHMGLMLLMLLLITLNSGAMTPLWGSFIETIGGSLKSAGIAIAILNIGGATFTALFSFIESMFPKQNRLFVVFSFFLYALFYLGYFFITKVSMLYLCSFGIALANGFFWPAFNAIYQTTFEEDSAPLGWGIQATFYDIGIGLGAYVGVHLAHNFNFHVLFLTMFVVALAAATASFFSLPRTEGQSA